MLTHAKRLRFFVTRSIAAVTATAARRLLSTDFAPCSTPEEDFKMFAKFARGNPTFFKDAIATQQQIDSEANMVALELTLEVDGIRRSVKWPTFIRGQDAETQPQVYFHRFGGFDDIRYEKTLKSLKENSQNNAAWMGSPGIGKSTSYLASTPLFLDYLMSFFPSLLLSQTILILRPATGVNFILFELVANLGALGFPRVLFYRNFSHIVTFSLCSQSDEVVVDYDVVFTHLSEINALMKDKHKKTPGQCCLVLEISETEDDPCLQMNTFVTISAGDALEKLKTFSKTGPLFLLVGPPTREQIHFMEWERFQRRGAEAVWYLTNPSFADDTFVKLSNLSETQVSEKKAIFRSLVSNMLDVVGPIPRSFTSKHNFHFQWSGLLDTHVGMAMLETINLTSFNTPRSLKYCLAPYPKSLPDPQFINLPLFESPRDYYFDFLSDRAKGRFINAPFGREHAAAMLASGTYYLIADGRVAESLKKRLRGADVADWEWYEDVGFDRTLNSSHSIAPIKIPFVETTSTIPASYLQDSVDDLKEGCLYESKAQTFLGEMVMVDHNTKTCFLFHVTEKGIQYHPVKLSVLENVMNRLKIREKNYTLHLIFVTDFSTKYPLGSKFEMEQTLKEKQNHDRGRAVTLSQWKDQWSDQEGHLSHFVKSSIVRTKLSVSEELPLVIVESKKTAAGHKKGRVSDERQNRIFLRLLILYF
jgi:hypothetical protein